MPKLLAILPCYNEETTVGNVVRELRKGPVLCDILVVDDGSMDRTYEEAIAAGANVVRLPVNLGIGAAVQTGYRYAVRNSYDIAAQIDGDGQHPPSELERLIHPIVTGEADLTIGSRYISGDRFQRRVSSLSRVIGGFVLSLWTKVLCGAVITDPTSGFRAGNRKVIERFARDYPVDYPEPVSVLGLVTQGYSVCEVAVRMTPRTGGTSSIRNLKTLVYMTKVMWTMFLNRMFKRS